MNAHKTWVLVLILTLTIGLAGVLRAQNGNLADLLEQVKNLVGAGKMSEAVDKIEEGKALADALQSENLALVERYHWDAAITHQDFAKRLQNPDQKRQFTELARDKFQDYIDWYHSLIPEDKARLEQRQVRIMKATLYMGYSIIGTDGARALFAKYGEIPDVRYLNSEALRLWQRWLHACPNYSAPSDSSLPPSNLCDRACAPQWKLYGQFLKEWAMADWSSSNIADVPKRIIDLRTAEGDELVQSVEQCGG